MLDRVRGRWLMLAVLLVIPACGKKSDAGHQSRDTPSTPESELKDVADILRLLASEGKRPPAEVQEMLDATADPAPGINSVKEGRIVMNWGAGIVTGSSAILAYDRNVPQDGGLVLLQDGTIKKMTSAEFQSAPKAR